MVVIRHKVIYRDNILSMLTGYKKIFNIVKSEYEDVDFQASNDVLFEMAEPMQKLYLSLLDKILTHVGRDKRKIKLEDIEHVVGRKLDITSKNIMPKNGFVLYTKEMIQKIDEDHPLNISSDVYNALQLIYETKVIKILKAHLSSLLH